MSNIVRSDVVLANVFIMLSMQPQWACTFQAVQPIYILSSQKTMHIVFTAQHTPLQTIGTAYLQHLGFKAHLRRQF